MRENAAGSLGNIFPKSHKEKEINWENSISIILDTANTERIDSDLWIDAQKTFKIDHHPEVDDYAIEQIVSTIYSSTCEIIADIILNQRKLSKYKLDGNVAKFLYLGIATDTGRFLFSNTSDNTLAIVSELSKEKFNRQKLLNTLYEKTSAEVKYSAYVQSVMKLDKPPVVYAIMEKGIEKEYKIEYSLAASNVYSLKNIKGYPYQVYATYDEIKELWKVSLRSRKQPIVEIAQKYNGGGHPQASGAKVKTLKEVKEIINEVAQLKK